MMAKLIEVIEVEVNRGCGHSDARPCDEQRFDAQHLHQPIRVVTQYFSVEGELLAERDPVVTRAEINERVVAMRSAR